MTELLLKFYIKWDCSANFMVRGEALIADAVENQLVMLHAETVPLPYFTVQRRIHRDPVEINDGAAVVADEVGVGLDDGIKALLPIDYADTADHALLLKKGQVPIDRPQREVGMGGLQFLIHPVGGWVEVGIADGL
jgi:hypothetical protein